MILLTVVGIFTPSTLHVTIPNFANTGQRLAEARAGATFAGLPTLAVGGVARNLAAGLQLLGKRAQLITALGNDSLAQFARQDFARLKLPISDANDDSKSDETCKTALACNATNDDDDVSTVVDTSDRSKKFCAPRAKTPSCFSLVFIDAISGLCEFVVANLDACQLITADFVSQKLVECSSNEKPAIVVADANLSAATMKQLIARCSELRIPLFVEPTDVLALPNLVGSFCDIRPQQNNQISSATTTKTTTINNNNWNHQDTSSLFCLSPNLVELRRLIQLFGFSTQVSSIASTSRRSEVEIVEEAEKLAKLLMIRCMPRVKCLLVTLDSCGLLVALRNSTCTETSDTYQVPSVANSTINLSPDLVHESERLTCNDLAIFHNSSATNRSDYNAWVSQATMDTTAISTQHFACPHIVKKPSSGSGAGDSFASAFISALIDKQTIGQCVDLGFKASHLSLNSHETIPRTLSQLCNKQQLS